MNGKQAEIIDENNFYNGMIGNVIKEDAGYVFLEISFANLDSHRVMFYKEQVREYRG
jgi:hypothetical protein